MSWSPIEPPPLSAGKRGSLAVTLSLLADSRRYVPMMRLVIRVPRIPGAEKWLRTGASIAVLWGQGEHAGWVRLQPGGRFLLTHAGGRGDNGTLAVRLPIPKGCTAKRKAPAPCEFETGHQWLTFALPDWAAPPPRHVGISERVADPAAALRGARA